MSAPLTPTQSPPGAPSRSAGRALTGAYHHLRQQLAGSAFFIAILCVVISPLRFCDWPDVLLLTALAVIVSLLPVRLPGGEIVSSFVTPVLVAIAGLHGATAAIFAALVSTVASGLTSMPRSRRFRFDSYVPAVSVIVVSIGSSALLYALLNQYRFPHSGVRAHEVPDWRAWLALPFCALLAFVLGSVFTTLLTSRYFQQRWDIIWHNDVRWMLPSALVMSPVGFLTAVLYGQHWWLGVGFILLPIYMLRMATVTHDRTMAAYKQGVELLGRIMQEAHPYTHGHLHRVAHWAKMIAEEMSLPASSMQHIEDAAILHDIGKVAVDDRVLNKVGKLTDDDWAMIRRHPVTGADLVIQMSVLGKVGHWIRHHHERPDGKGYPDQLQGDDIPLESCIISVVDAFDAMVGGPAKEDQRPYRQPMTQEAAIEELRRHAGTQFHAGVVEVFISILEREREMEATGQHPSPRPDIADDSLWASPPQMAVGI